jgi:hypothetical protein
MIRLSSWRTNEKLDAVVNLPMAALGSAAAFVVLEPDDEADGVILFVAAMLATAVLAVATLWWWLRKLQSHTPATAPTDAHILDSSEQLRRAALHLPLALVTAGLVVAVFSTLGAGLLVGRVLAAPVSLLLIDRWEALNNGALFRGVEEWPSPWWGTREVRVRPPRSG